MLNKSVLRSVAATLPDGSKVSLDRYISEMSGHIPPFPTAWRERLDRLVLPAAVFNDEPELRAFVEALGLSEVRASAEMALRWDEKTQDLTIEPISIDVDDVAAATFEARVGGVPKLVFENPQAAQAALGTLAFTSAKFKLRNSRLVQTALAKFGADMGMSPEQVQEFVLGQVRQGLAALNSPAFAEEVLRAVSEFLADPRTMTVEARPQQAVPVMQILGLAAVAPQDIIRLLAVSITAQ